MDTTLDGFLNRRVTLEQPAKGFRAGLDTVFLAASVATERGGPVLDLGCGAGGAMICLAARVPDIRVLGLEIQPFFVELCRKNIERNHYDGRLDVIQGDATALPKKYRSTFEGVIMNPPFHDADSHGVSPDVSRGLARSGTISDLKSWFQSAADALRPGGSLTLIYRGDRLALLLELAEIHLGSVDVLPLLQKLDGAPKRVLMRIRKDGIKAVTRRQNLLIHKEDGSYTDRVEAILRHGAAIDFADFDII